MVIVTSGLLHRRSPTSGIRTSITGSTPVEDESTVRFKVDVTYQSLSWTVYRRFSEFDSLMMELTGCGLAFLPPLPPKTFVKAPMASSDTIRTRTHVLHVLLRRLIQRPDTRSSLPLLRFIEFEKHTDVAYASPLQLKIADDAGDDQAKLDDPRFAVSGMQVNSTQTIIIAAHEDSTAMARLGRVWSVVEPDELGSVNVYHRVKSTGGPPPYEGRGRWKCIMRETSSVKMRVVATVEAARQFVIGTESGTLVGYSLPSTQQPEPKLLWRLDAHGPHPVTAIALGEAGRIVTVGLDNAVRVVDVVLKPTPSGQLYSGGRLNKRLKGSAYLTSVVVDSYGRAYIGSSGGEVFIFDTTTAPKPTFLHQFSSHDGSGVAALCIPRSLNSSDPSTVLLVAHDACVSMYDIQNPGYEKRMLRLKKWSALIDHLGGILPATSISDFSRLWSSHQRFGKYTKRSSAGRVSCVAFNTERRMVAAGYTSGVVALWSLSAAPEDSPIMSAARLVTHPEVADVTAIIWTPSTGGDVGEADRIYTGTEEGRIKVWTLPGTAEDYNHLPDLDDEGEGRNSASAEAIVDRLASSTAYSGLLDSAPAVRGKEMATESDDDEW